MVALADEVVEVSDKGNGFRIGVQRQDVQEIWTRRG
jgi:hypothetical protein